MEFYDLCLKTVEAIEQAKTLGYSGVGVVFLFEKEVFEKINSAKKNSYGIDVSFGVELQKDVKQKAKDMRKNIELMVIRGREREAVETPEVDVLFPEEINHIMAKLAKKNGVALGFDFSPLLHASKQARGKILSCYFKTAKLVRKYHVPFVLTSGALSPWDVRSPSELIAFGRILGFNERDCLKALSGEIIKENRKRLGKNWIMPGVEVL